jgi:hypothetical protein
MNASGGLASNAAGPAFEIKVLEEFSIFCASRLRSRKHGKEGHKRFVPTASKASHDGGK